MTDIFSAYGFKKMINCATRGSNCLDNIFINFSLDRYHTKIFDTGLSDHLGQGVVVSGGAPKRTVGSTRVVRTISDVGKMFFFESFSTYVWSSLNDLTVGANHKYTAFHNIFMHCFNECFPERRICRQTGPIELLTGTTMI